MPAGGHAVEAAKKEKILLVTNGFPFGNSERGFIPTEYETLRERFDVYIAARIPEPEAREWDGVDRSRVFCTGSPRLGVLPVLRQLFRRSVISELAHAASGCGIKLALRRAGAVLRYSARADEFVRFAKKIVDGEGIRLIYTFWCTQATLGAVRMKKKRPGLRVITRFHGYDLYNERTEEGLQPFRRAIAGGCERLVFACEAGRDYFCDHWSVPEEKCTVSYLGTRRMEPIEPREVPPLVIVSCSNLIPLKRVDLIIEALSILPPDVRAEWHHIGDGALRAELERRAEELLAPRGINRTFHGEIKNEELRGLYGSLGAALFVTASSTEGVPVTIQEAFAMGIPAAATSVGGIPELVYTGRTGYLLPESVSARELADAIADFYRLPEEEKRAMRANAVELWREKCDAEKNSRRLVEDVAQILK